MTAEGEIVELDGRRYLKLAQHHPILDERGRHVDWKWTHMALVPLEEEKRKKARIQTDTGYGRRKREKAS